MAVAADPKAMPARRSRPFAVLLACLIAVRSLDKDPVSAAISSLWTSYVKDPALDRSFDLLQKVWVEFPWPKEVAERLSLRYSMPAEVVEEWVRQWGELEAEDLCRASNGASPVTARANSLMMTRDKCREKILSEGVESEPTRISPDGLHFPKRGAIQALTSFKLGAFEMQDEGSQILSYLVQPKPGEKILDACAGGGGKTLHLAALMRNTGRIVATDRSSTKLESLRLRLRRAGVSIVEVRTHSQHGDGVPAETFDAVLVDAPCSGTGTLRRNPWLKLSYTPEALTRLLKAQKELLRFNAQFVRPGGRLVYATCSLQRRENEEQIEEFIRDHGDFTLVPASEILATQGLSITGVSKYLTLLPHRHGTDGYFGAVLQRTGDSGQPTADGRQRTVNDRVIRLSTVR